MIDNIVVIFISDVAYHKQEFFFIQRVEAKLTNRGKQSGVPLERKMATMKCQISEEKAKNGYIHSNCQGGI